MAQLQVVPQRKSRIGMSFLGMQTKGGIVDMSALERRMAILEKRRTGLITLAPRDAALDARVARLESDFVERTEYFDGVLSEIAKQSIDRMATVPMDPRVSGLTARIAELERQAAHRPTLWERIKAVFGGVA